MTEPTADEVKAAKRLIAQANMAKARAKKQAKASAKAAASGPVTPDAPPSPAPDAEPAFSAPTPAERYPATETVGAAPLDDDGELAFIDATLSNVIAKQEFRGVQTDFFKKVFDGVGFALTLRRRLRAEVRKIGPGQPLPGFMSLGLNPSTGLPEKPKPKVAPAPAPTPAPSRRVDPNDPLAKMAASLKATISASMAERAEKHPQPVAAAS